MLRLVLKIMLIFCLFGISGATAAPNDVKAELLGLRSSYVKNDLVGGGPKLRIVVDSSAPVKAVGRLENKDGLQLIVDITGAGGNINAKTDLQGVVADEVRAKRIAADKIRLEVDLVDEIAADGYRVFTLLQDIKNNKPFRVVIDINKPKAKPEYNYRTGLKGKVIAVDPGHGGSDPGAIGPGGTREKDLTLDFSLRFKTALEKAGAKVILTRQSDRDVFAPYAGAVDELRARTLVANNARADVFVSFHINSFRDRSISGASAYYAAKTNYDWLLAKLMHEKMLGACGMADRGVSQARFYVIRHSYMPAVLLEIGFISNPVEERLLRSEAFRQKAVEGLVQGLDAFFTRAAKTKGR